MKKIKYYSIVPVMALLALFLIASRSPEGISSQGPKDGMVVSHDAGSMTLEEMTSAKSAEATTETAEASTKVEKVTATDHKLSLKEKVAAKMVAKKLKKEMDSPGMTAGGKSQLVAFLLCLFLGYLGIHRFYLGYIGIGVLELLTAGLCGILTLIDFIRIIIGDLGPKGGSYDQTF